MIDVYAAKGTFSDKRGLNKALNQALMRWEKVPLIPWFLDNTATFIQKLEAHPGQYKWDNNCVRIQVRTPAGVLDRDKKIGVTREMADIVAAAVTATQSLLA